MLSLIRLLKKSYTILYSIQLFTLLFCEKYLTLMEEYNIYLIDIFSLVFLILVH